MNIDEPLHWLQKIISLAERVAQLVVEYSITVAPALARYQSNGLCGCVYRVILVNEVDHEEMADPVNDHATPSVTEQPTITEQSSSDRDNKCCNCCCESCCNRCSCCTCKCCCMWTLYSLVLVFFVTLVLLVVFLLT